MWISMLTSSEMWMKFSMCKPLAIVEYRRLCAIVRFGKWKTCDEVIKWFFYFSCAFISVGNALPCNQGQFEKVDERKKKCAPAPRAQANNRIETMDLATHQR